MVIKGYIVQDESGILPLLPASQPTEDAIRKMMDYIRKNKVLQTVYAEPGEDWIDLAERLRVIAETWRKRAQSRVN